MLPSLLYMWTFLFFGLRNQSPHLWQGMIPKSFMDGLHYFIIYWLKDVEFLYCYLSEPLARQCVGNNAAQGTSIYPPATLTLSCID